MSHELLRSDVSKFWQLLHLGDERTHTLYVVCATEQMDLLLKEYTNQRLQMSDLIGVLSKVIAVFCLGFELFYAIVTL